MIRRLLAAGAAAAMLFAGAPAAQSQSGANVGSLSCTVAGGVGFVFGSSKELSCLFTRTDGKAERYAGSIKEIRYRHRLHQGSADGGWSSRLATSPQAPWPGRTAAQRHPARSVSVWAQTFFWAAATSKSPCSPSASRAASG